jgi:hypothetical protein
MPAKNLKEFRAGSTWQLFHIDNDQLAAVPYDFHRVSLCLSTRGRGLTGLLFANLPGINVNQNFIKSATAGRPAQESPPPSVSGDLADWRKSQIALWVGEVVNATGWRLAVNKATAFPPIAGFVELIRTSAEKNRVRVANFLHSWRFGFSLAGHCLSSSLIG